MINFGTIELMIIVGIGYNGQELLKRNSKTFWKNYVKNRARDYIPKEFKLDICKRMKYFNEKRYLDTADDWNVEKFKDFIEKELTRYINKNYRSSNQNTLFGYSLGGLFTAFMMLNNSNIFEKYLILSPVFGIDSIINNLDKYKVKKETLIYLSVGSLENDEKSSMVKDLEKFYSKLAKDKIKSKTEVVQGKNHATIIPIGIAKGLRFIFKKL